MVLTRGENELLTRVGPGTPMGELLRRYWHPIAVAQELTEGHPTKFVRVLGEDLVLFRDKSGRAGLIGDHCSHRGASLLYGRVEERGIACAYHGWLYDVEGNCLETPAEPADSKLYLTVKHKAYPVQTFLGLYWAYMGPPPPPVIPKYELYVRKDGRHRVVVYPVVKGNWLQMQENAVDPWHGMVLHQDANGKPPPPNTTRGGVDDIERIDCWDTSYGVMKQHTYRNGHVRAHPMIFPNILEVIDGQQFKVPIDDTHTWFINLRFLATEDGSIVDDEGEPEVEYHRAFRDPPEARHPFARHSTYETLEQDLMAWETQGEITDRTTERLGTSDRWIVEFREMLFENIRRVQRGLDPFGVIRDPDHEMINTNLEPNLPARNRRLRELLGETPGASARRVAPPLSD